MKFDDFLWSFLRPDKNFASVLKELIIKLVQEYFIHLFLFLRLEGGETLKYGCVCRTPCGKV